MADLEFNSDMEAAKKIKGDVLVWWPVVKLDDDDMPTLEVERGSWVVTQWSGNGWDEPDYLEAMGSWFGDDCCYASEPTHWLQVPKPIPNRKEPGFEEQPLCTCPQSPAVQTPVENKGDGQSFSDEKSVIPKTGISE